MDIELTEHIFESERHTTSYLAAGPEDGPKVVFVHGWPELSLSWRHQLASLGALGFRAIAPDMRGYGKSSIYKEHSAYALRESVHDMCDLHSYLSVDPVIWVGHDWGSPVVWSVARHHPERVAGVASLCVPMGLEDGSLMGLIDREVYPEQDYPVGQWDYMMFYLESFDVARKQMESDPYNFIKMLFRKGDATGKGRPAFTASTRANGGWFIDGKFPDLPLDTDVLSHEEASVYAKALDRNGFFGPNSWYMNHESNRKYSGGLSDDYLLEKPVLFIHAEYDYVCETVESNLAQPMRTKCRQLTEVILQAGHWVAQEKGSEVSAALARWLEKDVKYWPDC